MPSLKGVWYRGPFEHNGSVATLEDWFDPRRLRDDYVPTGWKGYGVKTAVKGHEFGLELSAEDKRALIDLSQDTVILPLPHRTRNDIHAVPAEIAENGCNHGIVTQDVATGSKA